MDKNLFKGLWISPTEKLNSCYIKKNIVIDNFKKAKIDVTGLGFFELFINGKKVGKDVLVPSWTNYCYRNLSNKLTYPCNDEFNYRICYLEYDISEYLKFGNNEIIIQLSNGWFRQNKRNAEGDLVYGEYLTTIFQVELTLNDGKVIYFYSDGTEKFSLSEIVDSNVYLGEIHDYSISNSFTKNVKSLDFKTKLVKQIAPTDVVTNRLLKNDLISLSKYKNIFALPYSITGRVVLKCLSNNVTIRYSEEVRNGELDFESCGGDQQIQSDNFLNAFNKIVYSKFSIHCFRYFEIIGDAEIISVEEIYSDIKKTISLSTNNDTLNWIFDSYIRTQLCNMHYGVPSDCPHRERLGYTGDGQLTCESALLSLDCVNFYKKWLDDIIDCQDVKTGHVQHTAPFYGGGGGPIGWGGAIAILPLKLFKISNDISFLSDNLPFIEKWFNYIADNMENGLIVKEIEGGWCLGDWCVPSEDLLNAPVVLIPAPFVNGCLFIKILQEYLSLANDNLIKLDVAKYASLIEFLKSSVISNFYNADSNSFCNNVQGANLFAIDIGLGDEKLIKSTVLHYKKTLSFDTGIFGTEILIRFLCKYDRQTAFDLLTSKNDFTFFSMMSKGATTLFENWNGFASHNHPMFGACIKDIIYSILGISFIDGKNKIYIDIPNIIGLDSFVAEFVLNKGIVKIEYLKSDKQSIKISTTDDGLFVVDNKFKKIGTNLYEP